MWCCCCCCWSGGGGGFRGREVGGLWAGGQTLEVGWGEETPWREERRAGSTSPGRLCKRCGAAGNTPEWRKKELPRRFTHTRERTHAHARIYAHSESYCHPVEALITGLPPPPLQRHLCGGKAQYRLLARGSRAPIG